MLGEGIEVVGLPNMLLTGAAVCCPKPPKAGTDAVFVAVGTAPKGLFVGGAADPKKLLAG